LRFSLTKIEVREMGIDLKRNEKIETIIAGFKCHKYYKSYKVGFERK